MKKNLPETLIKSANLFPVVGIGASAGGLDAFKQLLQAIPEDSGMAYVLVQHLAPTHDSLLPEILQKVTTIPVSVITDDIKVEPNHIYVIPSNKMMVATDGVLLLAPRPAKKKNERNLPIDLFFTSLAEVHQSHAIGVVLSGTATDGTLGLKAIKDHGGITFAQDEESAAYEGMPNSAVQAGVVDFILHPDKIPAKLLEVTKIINTVDTGQNLPLENDEVFKQIISLLRIRKGTDFTYYKQTTIRRRILRRMAINKNEEPAAYLKYLRENKQEQDVLYQDLLIPVTSFFRDRKIFDNLCEHVFPHIVKNKPAGETIRVWVAGCSTGEEAYSIAICIKEFLATLSSKGTEERVQIFASDLSEPAIAKARLGIYTKIELAGITEQRLNDFFTKINGSYQVNRQVRDMCVFASHNFLKDPPFGKIDLISCRNVLIYMEPYLQKKALTTFHYSLNPKGFLLLGKSETTAGVPDLFVPVAKNEKLYTRKDVPSRFVHVVSRRDELNLNQNKDQPKTENMRSDFQKTADDIMLSKYTPAGVVVNEAMDIVQFRGSTSNYLEQSSGKPSHNLLVMAKYGLAFELRNILHKAKKEKAPVIKENISVQVNGGLVNIAIEAIPLPNTIDPHYLILFHDSNTIGNRQLPVANKKVKGKARVDDKDLRIQQLEQELAQNREDMRSITEDQEAANEELQSANEELLSGSEELQSLNEELETSKEELQSTNEELTVVNQEMISLNEQVSAARNYAESIVANIREPLLVLDKTLRVKTANKSFYNTFKVNEQETEGVLIYDLGNKQWNIPELRTLLEKILPEKLIFNDFEVTYSFADIGELTMLLNAREVINKSNLEKLILLSIEDITERKEAAKKIEESEKQQAFLLYFSDTLRAEATVDATANRALQMLSEHLKLDRCYIGVYQLAEDCGVFPYQIGNERVPPMPASVRLSDFPDALRVAVDRTLVIDDVAKAKGLADSDRQNLNALGLSALVAATLRRGEVNPLWSIVVVSATPRHWTLSEVNLIEEVTERTWAAIERAKAIEALRKSEEKYRFLFTSIEQGFTLCELIRNKEGKGIDLYIREVNPNYEKQTGIDREMVIDKPLMQVFPSLYNWLEKYVAVVDNQQPVEFEHYFEDTDRWFTINAYPVEKDKFAVLFNNITARKQVEEKILESERRYHNMIYSSPSMIGIFRGEEMIIEIVNDAILNSWGKTKDIIGKSIFSVLPEIVVQGLDKLLLNVYKTGIPFHSYEMPVTLFRYGKEEVIYYSFIYQPQRNLKGEIEGVAVIANEVTPQALVNKKIKASEENFRQLAELMPEKISKADADGNVIFYNHNWLTYTGLSREELKDNGWAKIMHPDELEEISKHWQHSINTGNNFEMEIRILNKKGEYIWHLSRATAVKDNKGKIIEWLGTATEIQEQIHQRELLEKAVAKRTNELHKANKKLIFESTEKEKRAEELVIANKKLIFESTEKEKRAEELMKMNKELEAFAYVSSHDLQEPLRKIQTFAGRILEKENAKLSANGKKYFHIMQDSANRMQTLIEDLLSFTGLTTAERKFEITDLNDIIEKVKTELKETIEKKHATIEATELCPVNIIVFQFHQLMQNLISNALKFSRPQHPPHIIIKSSIVEGSALKNHKPALPAGMFSAKIKYCHISFADNGIGFEKKFSEQIFEVFQKLHSKEEYAGTGIGLAIVRKIVDNHNGIITATGKLNKGSTFDIFIPAI